MNRFFLLFVILFSINNSTNAANADGNKPLKKDKYLENIYINSIVMSSLEIIENVELSTSNPRFMELSRKFLNNKITEAEKEEFIAIKDEYSCKKNFNEYNDLLSNNSEKLVLISFYDPKCHKCNPANILLAELAEKYDFQLDILEIKDFDQYIENNNLESQSLSLIRSELKNKKLHDKIVQNSNLPVFAYDRNYGIVFPVIDKISKVKNKCSALMASAGLLLLSQPAKK